MQSKVTSQVTSSSKVTSQVRDWVFTKNTENVRGENGFNELQLESGRKVTRHLAKQFDDCSYVRYACLQLEVGDATGRMHVQGWISCTRSVRLGRLTALSPGTHWEPRRGTRQEADEYCSKPDGRLFGPLRVGDGDVVSAGRGRRTDILQFVEDARNSGVDSALDERLHYIVRYPRGVESLRRNLIKKQWDQLPNFRKVSVYVHWGDAGVGKTKKVFQLAEQASEEVYRLFSYQPEWWDGYTGQKYILFDDFYGQIKLSRLLQLLDGYKLMVPVKGGHTYLTHEQIHITSNKHWHDWYEATGTNDYLFNALKRRVGGNVTEYKVLQGLSL